MNNTNQISTPTHDSMHKYLQDPDNTDELYFMSKTHAGLQADIVAATWRFGNIYFTSESFPEVEQDVLDTVIRFGLRDGTFVEQEPGLYCVSPKLVERLRARARVKGENCRAGNEEDGGAW